MDALTEGADDVLTLPFDQDELLARMRAVIRRSGGLGQSTTTVGPLTLDTKSRDVAVNGIPIHLTKTEFSILELLVLRRGSPVSKGGILSHLYGGRDEPEIKIIDVFVCKLRRKLAEAGAYHLITTVVGRGYAVQEDSQHVPPPRTVAAPTQLRASAG